MSLLLDLLFLMWSHKWCVGSWVIGVGTTHCLFFKEMTLNKMVWNFWHQFLIRFSMLFQMVPFILLCMVAHLTITWLVETIPTANQRALCWWFLKLPWREKRKVPSERAMKTESETGVKSDTPFCSRLPIKKTNSGQLQLSWAGAILIENFIFREKSKVTPKKTFVFKNDKLHSSSALRLTAIRLNWFWPLFTLKF